MIWPRVSNRNEALNQSLELPELLSEHLTKEVDLNRRPLLEGGAATEVYCELLKS